MDEQSRQPSPGPGQPIDAQLNRESWKIFQIMTEFVEGFERLAQIKPSVSGQRWWARYHGGSQQGRFCRPLPQHRA